MNEYVLDVYLEQFDKPVGKLVGYEDYTLHFGYDPDYTELGESFTTFAENAPVSA